MLNVAIIKLKYAYTHDYFPIGAELKTTPAATKSSSSYSIPTRTVKEKGKATQSQQQKQELQQLQQQEREQKQQQQSGPQQTAVDAYAYSDPNAMYSYGTDPSAYYQYYYQQQQEQQEYNSGQVSNTNESEASVFGDLDDTAVREFILFFCCCARLRYNGVKTWMKGWARG